MNQTLSVLLYALLFSFSAAYAQKDFNGTITYTFTVTGPNSATVSEQMPKAQTFMVLGNKARMATVDKSNQELDLMIFDLQADKKWAIFPQDKAIQEIPAPQAHDIPNLKTERTNEKATIQGYSCVKYNITDLSMPDAKIYIWAAETFKIPNQSGKCSPLAQYQGVKGIPLRQQFNQGDMVFTIEAQKVDLTKPKTELMEIPKDYTAIPYQSEEHDHRDHGDDHDHNHEHNHDHTH